MTTNFIDSYSEGIISELAQDETGKRQYYRPVYSLHKWWARRPGTLFRSIILLAASESNKIFLPARDGSVSLQSDYFKDHELGNLIVLDPFMGGGTTLVEASRLGAKVVGCDLNPVSYWIVRETLKPIDLSKLDIYYHQLELTVGKQIQSLYKTQCPYCGNQCNSLYVFWIRYVKCMRCSREIYLYKRTLLNEGLSRNRPPSYKNPATVFCPQCFALNEWYGHGKSNCRSCGLVFDPTQGNYDQGFYTCPECVERKVKLIETLTTGQKMQEKLVAIEYWCDQCNKRLYKEPDESDLGKILAVEKEFERIKDNLIYPKQEIFAGDSSHRWRIHNYLHYYDIFNHRQLLAFNYLISGIKSIEEEEYRNAFTTVFSNSLEYNNLMTPYNYPHRKLHHLFNYHALPLTTTPVENVVWGAGKEGAGTFVNCYQRYVNAKKYCQSPFDRYKKRSGEVHTVVAKQEKIAAQLVSSFQELMDTPRGSLLLCGDSASLPEIPDRSVDLVITDPPYFDNIHYSELSNFFYVWLKCLIDHPYFKRNHVPTDEEAIVNEKLKKSGEEYQDLLLLVFKECERVLKDDGKLIFTFHHTKWEAWWKLLIAISRGGFRVVDSFPVKSEYKVNPHIRNKQSLDMDLVLICQKRSIPFDPLPLALENIVEQVRNRQKGNFKGNGDFLYLMGELLTVASSNKVEIDVSYEWFAGILSHYDNSLTAFSQSKDIIYDVAKPLQLRLLDADSKDEPD